jgi:peptidoglycan/xylan/chitin deacetylase (PgdA/CDA1 family)
MPPARASSLRTSVRCDNPISRFSPSRKSSRHRQRAIVVFIAAILSASAPTALRAEPLIRDANGAIIRADVATKSIALVFTGDQHGEGAPHILEVLKQRCLRGSFFLTGNFLRDAKLRMHVRRIVADGHYLGPHSDAHPLYCAWHDREKTLVTQSFFKTDLSKNITDLRALGALRPKTPVYFVPPYEWHNRQQVDWARQLGVTVINFTPGSGSNRDYAPEGDPRFVPSQTILRDILAYEQKDPHGLNGFLLLTHVGSGRRDRFHRLLGPLCDELLLRGYQFERVDNLLRK